MAQTERFAEGATPAVDNGRDIVLELSQLTFLDSSGIRAILSLAMSCSSCGCAAEPAGERPEGALDQRGR